MIKTIYFLFFFGNFAIAHAWKTFPPLPKAFPSKALSSITQPAQAALKNAVVLTGAVGISLFSLINPAFADSIPAVG